MRRPPIAALTLAAVLAAGCQSTMVSRGPISAAETRESLERLVDSPTLSQAVEEACRRTLDAHPEADLTMDRIWAAAIDTTDPRLPLIGHWNGDEQVYPASVIKTVFMLHTYQKVVDGDLTLNRETRRLLREMIRVSSNVATQGIVDLLSGVTEVERIDDPAAYADWVRHREATNRHMRSLGFRRMNANQKTWDELPDENSVELQFLGGPHAMGYENGNRLTAREIAQVMWQIDQDLAVSRGACRAMRGLLRRGGSHFVYGDELRPIGRAVPEGARSWSKGGSTGRFRHDTATVALPDGRRLVMVVFTEMPIREGFGGRQRSEVLVDWAREMLAAMP